MNVKNMYVQSIQVTNKGACSCSPPRRRLEPREEVAGHRGPARWRRATGDGLPDHCRPRVVGVEPCRPRADRRGSRRHYGVAPSPRAPHGGQLGLEVSRRGRRHRGVCLCVRVEGPADCVERIVDRVPDLAPQQLICGLARRERYQPLARGLAPSAFSP